MGEAAAMERPRAVLALAAALTLLLSVSDVVVVVKGQDTESIQGMQLGEKTYTFPSFRASHAR